MRLEHRIPIFVRIIISSMLCILPITHSAADEASLDRAIDEYIKGFRACNEANSLRTEDLAQAKANFNYYTQQLNKAIEIDDSILQTTTREMHTNIKYCKRVESNILRAEATPILEQGIDFCKSAKTALTNSDLPLATQEIQLYQQLKEQALAISPNLLEVFALASKVRTCVRIENKLSKAKLAAEQAKAGMDKAILEYQSFNTQCKSIHRYISTPAFNSDQLLEVNKRLNKAKKSIKAARSNEKAFELAEETPNSKNSVLLTALVRDAKLCEEDVSASIRNTTKTKRNQQKKLSNASKSLAAALKECKEAKKKLNEPVSLETINSLKGIYNATSDVRESIVSNKALIKISASHESWPQSKSFNQNLKDTNACLSIFTATLNAVVPTEPTEETINEAIDDITDKTTNETANTPINAASNEPASDATQANPLVKTSPPAQQTQSGTLASSENDDDADTIDNTDNLDDEFDDFAEEETPKGRKSWTSIID